jgi:hypothetical protein
MLLIAVFAGLLAVLLVAVRIRQQRGLRPPGRHAALVPVSVRQEGERPSPRHAA